MRRPGVAQAGTLFFSEVLMIGRSPAEAELAAEAARAKARVGPSRNFMSSPERLELKRLAAPGQRDRSLWSLNVNEPLAGTLEVKLLGGGDFGRECGTGKKNRGELSIARGRLWQESSPPLQPRWRPAARAAPSPHV